MGADKSKVVLLGIENTTNGLCTRAGLHRIISPTVNEVVLRLDPGGRHDGLVDVVLRQWETSEAVAFEYGIADKIGGAGCSFRHAPPEAEAMSGGTLIIWPAQSENAILLAEQRTGGLLDFLNHQRLILMKSGQRENPSQDWMRSVALVDEEEVREAGFNPRVYPINSLSWRCAERHARPIQ